MTEFLIRHFIKDYKDVDQVSVRTGYGVFASIVGIFFNVLLFAVKLVVGMLLHSVSVRADAFNNLSDAGSSIISLVGVKMAGRPADRGHPFGHGRMEYIAALVVSFMIMEMGFSLLKESIVKIGTPDKLVFQVVSVLILCLSIGIKVWLGLFNRRLGQRIDSKVMMAVFTDSMADVLTTAATIFSIIFFGVTGINIDAFIGIGVALVVMWAGFGIARDSLDPLIGEAIDPQLYHKIKTFVDSYDGILGSHDLIVHNYGPNRSMATIHAEVPNNVDIEVSHEIIDRIERDSVKELGVFLVIHMDPIETGNERIHVIQEQINEVLKKLDDRCGIHDLRMVKGVAQTNLIFDMTVPFDYTEKKQKLLEADVMKRMKSINGTYNCVINTEFSYM